MVRETHAREEQETTQDNPAPVVTGDVEIPPPEWIGFFDRFSRQHQGWLADVTIRHGNEAWVGIQKCRVEGASSDHPTARGELYLALRQSNNHVTHAIKNPVKVVFRQDTRGAHEGLEITAADGTCTNLCFRIAAIPETLDGVLEDATGPRSQAPTFGQSTKAAFESNRKS